LCTACEDYKETPQTARRAKPGVKSGREPSQPETTEQWNNSVPPPLAKQQPPEPPAPEQPRVAEPMAPRVVPQVAQQNLYSGGQPPLGMPKIALSEQHARACPIKLGQVFPSVMLNDQAGQPQELKKFHGKYTLVVIWSASEPSSVEELGDLEAYAYQPYKNVGLNVVAVHTMAGKTKQPTEALQKYQPTFTILHDPTGELWAKVGKESLPRTFLLDGEGGVLWFDIEYSRTTRRQLQQALQAVMQEI
jgi:peroxiredoxin